MPDSTDQSDATPKPSPGLLTPDDFAERFRDSFRVLWLVAVGIVDDAALAEDVVQEAAVTGLNKIDQFDAAAADSSFIAWIGQIVRYVALNESRKQVKRRTTSLDPQALDSAKPSSDGTQPAGHLQLTPDGQLPADQGHFDDRVMAALNGTNPVARACLLLRTIENLDYASISALLDIPEGTAMSHVHRTRKMLRQRLSKPSGPPPARRADP